MLLYYCIIFIWNTNIWNRNTRRSRILDILSWFVSAGVESYTFAYQFYRHWSTLMFLTVSVYVSIVIFDPILHSVCWLMMSTKFPMGIYEIKLLTIFTKHAARIHASEGAWYVMYGMYEWGRDGVYETSCMACMNALVKECMRRCVWRVWMR